MHFARFYSKKITINATRNEITGLTGCFSFNYNYVLPLAIFISVLLCTYQ